MKYRSVMFQAPTVFELEEAINRHLERINPDTCQVNISHAGEGVPGIDRFIACVTHGHKEERR
jgi:hypothetical protein